MMTDKIIDVVEQFMEVDSDNLFLKAKPFGAKQLFSNCFQNSVEEMSIKANIQTKAIFYDALQSLTDVFNSFAQKSFCFFVFL